MPQGPHSHILIMGGGGHLSDIFGSEILTKNDFFGGYERHWDFFGLRKKIEGIFWVAKKGLRDFFGYVKKSSDFFGWTNA